MDYSLLIEALRQKQCLTDLEKDILDIWNELQKNLFDNECIIYNYIGILTTNLLYDIINGKAA